MPDPGIYKPATEREISAATDLSRASLAAAIAVDGAFQGVKRPVLFKGAAYTLTAADSGSVIVATVADIVLTLPATVLGLNYTFVLAATGLSTGTGLSVSPDAADKIMGNGFTSADNKDAILTGATDREGDALAIVADGALGWYVIAVTGTWAREA